MRRRRLIAFKITEECINCGTCEPVCPNEAISEGKDIYIIDPDKCTECKGFHDTQQCADACPVEACIPNPEHLETEEQLLSKAGRHKAGV